MDELPDGFRPRGEPAQPSTPYRTSTSPRTAKLTVVETVYHAPPAGQPTSVNRGWTKELTTDEEPYRRSLKVGAGWEPLDTGWVKHPSAVVLYNPGPDAGRGIPHPGRRWAVEACVLQVAVVRNAGDDPEPVVLLPVGESCRFRPADVGSLRVRCLGAEVVRLALAAFPG